MKYIVYYKTDNGQRYMKRVEAKSEKEAEKIVRNQWCDIKEITQITKC